MSNLRIFFIAVIIGMAVIIYIDYHRPCKAPPPTIIHDTIIKKPKLKTTIPFVVNLSAKRAKLLPVDTAAIIADYLATRVYADSLKLPYHLGNVVLQDSVSLNQITSRSYRYNLKLPSISPNAIYGGVILGRHIRAPTLYYRHHGWTYGAGYNMYDGSTLISCSYNILSW